MWELWIRLKSKTPKWAKRAQILFASLAAMGGSIVVLESSPEWLKMIAEKCIWIGGSLAAFAQFIISNTSKNKDRVNQS